jgi:hypothetical protein
METVYKVVKATDGNPVSLLHRGLGKYSLEYPPCRWIMPKIGHIFAFNNYNCALTRLNWWRDTHAYLYELWRAEAPYTLSIDREVVAVGYKDRSVFDIEDFWAERPINELYLLEAPMGAVLVPRIKLVGRLA